MAILFFAWGCGTKTPEVRGLNRRREADGSMPVHAQHERVKVHPPKNTIAEWRFYFLHGDVGRKPPNKGFDND